MAQTNILVVDDEKEIADLVEIYLVSDGYRVLKANNAQANQVGDVGTYFIGRTAFFQCSTVFARKFANAFICILDAPFYF